MARVIGTVVAPRQVENLHSVTLLVLQPVNEALAPVGEPLIATDATGQRGAGELVYFVASGDAVFTGPDGTDIPTDAAVLGIVNRISVVD